ncbi:G patch domain-containing protein 2 isoform X7 [Gadus morhua]|uniref:G patch domain-containing protein 2 isoform X7 n=1 Tax=Gadus morhua TaxID=8049 RepID=UPI0011B7276E|nr:G patch domain-containing protein 2 isoform X7 [Gadus morhua]
MFRAANLKAIGKAGTSWHFCRNMDELVHDLVSALEESSEQAARGFGDGGDHALAVGCLLKRQSRKRRGRKRRSDNPHPPWEAGHLSEGSESSGEEHKDYRACAGGVSGANSHARDNSDSDEQLGPKRRTPLAADPGRGKRPLWQDDLGLLGSAEGTHSLRRRRKVKRMAVDPPPDPGGTTTTSSSAAMLGPPPVPRAPPAPGCRLPGAGPETAGGRGLAERCGGVGGGGGGGAKSRVKKRKLAAHRPGAEAADEGVVVESEDAATTPTGGSKDRMELEEPKDSDEEMSDSDTSSVSNSSDGGLYTNDEGRQADDEQSDWFYDTEPPALPGSGGACGVAGVVPWWEREEAEPEELEMEDPVFNSILHGSFPLMSATSQRGGGARAHARHTTHTHAGGFHARLGRMHQNRVDLGLPHPARRQAKDEPWFIPGSRREHNQLHWDARSDRGHRRSCSVKTASRQTSGHLGSLCTGDVKRRRKAAPLGSTATTGVVGESASPIPDTNLGSRMMQTMGWNPGTGLGPEGRGITEPVRATLRPKGAGLGFN